MCSFLGILSVTGAASFCLNFRSVNTANSKWVPQLEREVELLTNVLARYAHFIQLHRNISEVYQDFSPAPTRDDR